MKNRPELKHPLSVEAEATALNVIADAMLAPDGPGNLTEAVYLCAEHLADISKSLKMPDPESLLPLIANFMDCFETVFSNDWECTKANLRDDWIDMAIAPSGDFIHPDVDDESNNWANRGCLLRAYRALRDALPEGYPFYRRLNEANHER